MAEVQLPQLGESVTESVITRWLVDVGDTIDVDQAIAEISTDKVDTEIPSPVAGTIEELRFDVDDTVEVGQVIAIITEGDSASTTDDDNGDDNGDDTDDDSDDTEATTDEDDTDEAADDDDTDDEAADDDTDDGDDEDRDVKDKADTDDRPAAPRTASRESTTGAKAGPRRGEAPSSAPSTTPVLASPLVRRLLREAGIDASAVQGSGSGGRITREDADRAIAQGGVAADARAPDRAPTRRERPDPSPTQIDFEGERTVTQDLSRIRKAIARSMMDSLHHTAQLTAAVEVDLTAVMQLRSAVKDAFKQREGASLTPLAIIARAVCMTLPRHPALNASIDQDEGTATYHGYINLGIAVDTERGLLVPNLKDAQDLDATGMAKSIGDVAKRTRDRKLGPDEIAGGTFTITNTGSMGTLFDTPILNPPEAAILATPAIEKRPVVISDGISDAIAIRWMTYLCLTYDHRIVDGADAARFLQDLKWVLEEHDFAPELGG